MHDNYPYPMSSPETYRTLYESLQARGKLDDPKILADLAWERGYWDFAFFAQNFFPHHCRAPFSSMHWDFCEDEADPSRRGRREAIAAPRGHAKTTFKLLFKAIHAIVYGYERYIVVVGQSAPEAQDKVRQVLEELENNERLIAVYGHLAPKGSRPGLKRSFTTRNGIKVQGVSVGQSIRGIKHGANRPTLIILDDVETLESALSPHQRQKTREWFLKDILKCGQTDGSTNFIFIGTCLHDESLLSELLETPGWRGRKYQAVLRFSQQKELWDEWKALYTNLSDPLREETAEAFFKKNRAIMMVDAEVLWPENEPYLQLMKQLVAEGTAAFYSEKQNEPFDRERQLFRMDEARYFEVLRGDIIMLPHRDGYLVPISTLSRIIAYHDPAMGDAPDGSGDFAAIVVVGQDKEGYMYVLDCFLGKVTPLQQIQAGLKLRERWGFSTLFCEDNNFQKLMIQMYDDEARKQYGQVSFQIRGVHQHQDKQERIATLEPDITNGHLLFNRDLDPRLIQQLKLFPTSYDDGPDALQGAVFQLKQPKFRSTGVTLQGRANTRRPYNRRSR